MTPKDINEMCVNELNEELKSAKLENNNPKIQRIYRRLKKEKQSIEKCLNTWPKSNNFRIAMNILVAEGKCEPVIMDNRIVHEIDMAEVLLKLFDMVHETANFKAQTLSQILNTYEPLLLGETEYQESELDYAEYRDRDY